VEAAGPGFFVVDAAGDAQVLQIDVFLPAPSQQALVEEVAVAEVAQTFVHAHVEPDPGAGTGFALWLEVGAGWWAEEAAKGRQDAGARLVLVGGEAGEDVAAVPPDGRREYAEFAEDLRVVEADGEGDEAAERGAGEPGVLAVRVGSERVVDEGFEFIDEEAGVERAFAAAVTPIAAGGVLLHAMRAGVGDADENDRFDEALADEAVGGGVRAPGAAGDVGGARVEEVLPVVEVQNREAAVGFGAVVGREPDADVAVVRQVAGVKALDAAEARVAVEVVWIVKGPETIGIHFWLRAVEGQMPSGCGARRGGTGGGLFVICRQVEGMSKELELKGEERTVYGSGYLRVDA
jgi:hypothetical protein